MSPLHGITLAALTTLVACSSNPTTDDQMLPLKVKCGNGVCNPQESCSSCPADCGVCPTPGALPVPGTIHADAYKTGGEGVGYHDTTSGNLGTGTCRSDDVDLKPGSGGHCIIGWFAGTEWLAYDVNVASAGTYTLQALVARGATGSASLHLEQNGVDVSGPVTVPATASWETFVTVTATVSLSAGTGVLKLVSDSSFFDIASFTLDPAASGPSCGDGTCNGTETCSSCADDCGACSPSCGDGTCNGTETCSSCADDCGACPPATEYGPRAITCPSGSISISPGTSIQTQVNANAAGATFCIKAGTHNSQKVIPKANNKFIGELGAILDGKGNTAYAFAGGGNGVTVENLVIKNYAPTSKAAAVDRQSSDPGTSYSGWIVSYNDIFDSTEAGIRTHANWHVHHNFVHSNGRYGMTGSGANGLIEYNEISENADIMGASGDSSGTKWVHTDGLILRGNYAHHNKGNGLWVDINNLGGLIEDNVSSFNTRSGIFWEVSCAAIIRNNFLEGNGSEHKDGTSWMSAGNGIAISNSPDVEVYGNTVVNNYKGIGAVNWNHFQVTSGNVTKCTPELKNLSVHDNTITHTGEAVAGISASLNSSLVYGSWNNDFFDNSYVVDSSARWRWDTSWKTYTQWKAIHPND